MKSSRKTLAGVTALLFVAMLTARLPAVTDNNSQCNGGGGCWTPCEASGSGSSELIGASQLPECSPLAMSNCTGGQEAICGVQYAFSSRNCDPATITSSHYSFGDSCSP